ncbi:hypothetical protein KAR91_07080 [Candidatus Pacearchaeota archaeon]|nr:hypothetical protein [Candidatus Pacearchaeota archaeon]
MNYTIEIKPSAFVQSWVKVVIRIDGHDVYGTARNANLAISQAWKKFHRQLLEMKYSCEGS